mmetsp:Transcript_3623/g.5854  ORF Transcript_3623/g.5854 Transcript_3623/m.5854 type:complete len:247 (+) Transcript_3623:373-1113(+)
MFAPSVLALASGQCSQCFFNRHINHIDHHAPCLQVHRNVSRLCRPTRRLTSKWRGFTRIDTDEVSNETDVIVHERCILGLEQAYFSSSPEVQTHPNPSIVRLKMLAPLVRLSLRRVPCSKVRTGPIVGYLIGLSADAHQVFGSCHAFLSPWSAIAELLSNPQSEAFPMWVIMPTNELVEMRINENFSVECFSELSELRQAHRTYQAPSVGVSLMRSTFHIQRHELKRLQRCFRIIFLHRNMNCVHT